MKLRAIAGALGVSEKTVWKALAAYNGYRRRAPHCQVRTKVVRGREGAPQLKAFVATFRPLADPPRYRVTVCGARRKGVMRLWFPLSALVLLVGCGDNQDEAGARDLLARVRADQYRTWDRAPGYPARRATGAPHSDAVDIYVNDVVAEVLALGEHDGTWPVGSIIAKDGFDGGDLEIIALMEKRSDGWFWAEYDDDGDPDYSGKPDVCIDCHAPGSDFVRAFALP